MKQYDTYKPSGIEWLGEIPEHWEVKRVKEIGNVVLGKMLCNTPQPGYLLKPYLVALKNSTSIPSLTNLSFTDCLRSLDSTKLIQKTWSKKILIGCILLVYNFFYRIIHKFTISYRII